MHKIIDFSKLYIDELVNPAFVPLMYDENRTIICYGGRGSSKSDFAAVKIAYRMIFEKDFKCVLIRNVSNTIKEGQYSMLKKVIERWGMQEHFTFLKSPLEITCNLNGNKIKYNIKLFH